MCTMKTKQMPKKADINGSETGLIRHSQVAHVLPMNLARRDTC